jgi:hypothetical protein
MTTDQSLTAEPSRIWYDEAPDLAQGDAHLGLRLVLVWGSCVILSRELHYFVAVLVWCIVIKFSSLLIKRAFEFSSDNGQ